MARNAVEGQDAVDRGGVGVNGKGDAEVDQLVFRRRGAGPQRGEADGGDSRADRGTHPAAIGTAMGQFTEIRVGPVVEKGVIVGKRRHRLNLLGSGSAGLPLGSKRSIAGRRGLQFVESADPTETCGDRSRTPDAKGAAGQVLACTSADNTVYLTLCLN